MPLCALTALCAHAMLAWVGAHTVFVSNVSMYQKSVICYLYKTRGLLFQSAPLVSPSVSLLCEVSNFSITSPPPVSRRGKRSLSHNFRSPSGFSLLFWEIFFFLIPRFPDDLIRDIPPDSWGVYNSKAGCQKRTDNNAAKISSKYLNSEALVTFLKIRRASCDGECQHGPFSARVASCQTRSPLANCRRWRSVRAT